MIISLLGYMGSGKSHISKLLADITGEKLIDLDKEISKKNRLSIPEIFEKKGEIFFRKQERELLEVVLATQDSCILSLGGGTPSYYNNMEILNLNSKTIYLKCSVANLYERLLKQKDKRPLIARLSDEEIPEFVAKHLLERNFYYSKAQYTIDCDYKSPDEIIQEIEDLW